MDVTRAMLAPGEMAPAFSLPGADDGQYTLTEALSAGPVLVTFFQQDCRACAESYLPWDALYEAHAGDDFQLWAVCLDEEDSARLFWENSGVSFPVLLDDGSSAAAYRLIATPSHFLVGTDGRVVAAHDAFDRAGWNAMMATLAELLGRPVADLEVEAPEFVAGCTLH